MRYRVIPRDFAQITRGKMVNEVDNFIGNRNTYHLCKELEAIRPVLLSISSSSFKRNE